MNVKTRIAAFESQNEELRRIATPTRGSSPAASPRGFGSDMRKVNGSASSSPVSEAGAPASLFRPASRTRSSPFETRSTTHSNAGSAISTGGYSVARSSTISGTSSTMAASEIRKTRLARSASTGNSSVASEPPPGSLMERRKQIKESRLRQRSPVAAKNTSIGEAYSKRRNGSLTPTGKYSPSPRPVNGRNPLKSHLNGTTNGSTFSTVSTKSRSVHYLTVPALSSEAPPKQHRQLPVTTTQQKQIQAEPEQRPQEQASAQFRKPSRPTPTAALHSNRRFVHSISAESDDSNKNQEEVAPSTASGSSSTSLQQKRHPAQLAKKHRMQRMKRTANDIDMQNVTNSIPSMGSEFDEEYDDVDYDTNEEAVSGLENPPSIQRVRGDVSREGSFLPQSRTDPPGGSVTTDDEATLTSVRRVVEARQEEYSADLLRDATPTKQSTPWSQVDGSNMESRRRASTLSPPTTAREAYGEEKSDKPSDMLRTASSSDYDSDQDASPMLKKQQQQQQLLQANGQQRQQPPQRDVASTPDWTEIPDVNGFFSRSRSSGFVHHSDSNRAEDEDSYGDSPSSLSYAERMRRATELKKKNARNGDKNPEGGESPLLNKDDFEHYRQQLDNSSTKIAAGVIGCAAVGCLVLGPVGLLLGPAAVGIGFGFMQIPEEHRNNMRDKAAKAFESAQQSALNASDTISQSCAVTYKDSGVSAHIPPDMSRCFTSTEDAPRHERRAGDEDEDEHSPVASDNKGEGPLGANAKGKSTTKGISGSDNHASPPPSKIRNKKVACLRNGELEFICSYCERFVKFRLRVLY